MKELTPIIDGATMLITLSSIYSTERNKRIDEAKETLPALARDIPNISYLIAGEGDERARLYAKAAALGVRVAHLIRAMAARLAAVNWFSSCSSS